MKRQTKLLWLAGATLGLALSVNGCSKKSEEPPASVGSAPSPPADPSTPGQTSSPSGDSGTSGSVPQKSDDAAKSQG